VYAKYFDRDSTRFADGLQATNAWNMGQGGFRVDLEAPGENNLTFQGDYYQGGVTQPQSPHIDLSGGNSLGRWIHSFSEEADLTVQMYYDHTHRRIPKTFTEDLDKGHMARLVKSEIRVPKSQTGAARAKSEIRNPRAEIQIRDPKSEIRSKQKTRQD
jgi:hypothetical protein